MTAYLFLASTVVCRAALLPPWALNTVVALGGDQCVPQPTGPSQCTWATEGTAFAYGYLIANDPDPLKRRYRVFLVTARHVVAEHTGVFHVRMNPAAGGARGKEFDIPAQATAGPWHFHGDESVDVAVLPVGDLKHLGVDIQFIPNDIASEAVGHLKEDGISAGDGAFVLGFPMNLAGAQKNYTIVRNAIVARIDQLFDGTERTFLLDGFVFPGNSGGPVFSRPDAFSIEGTKAHNKSVLVGMVISYDPYQDIAISTQTKRPRVLFEENSGLTNVVPVDYIDQTIENCCLLPGERSAKDEMNKAPPQPPKP